MILAFDFFVINVDQFFEIERNVANRVHNRKLDKKKTSWKEVRTHLYGNRLVERRK